MKVSEEIEKICIKCPWSDKRSLPTALYCFRWDKCKKRKAVKPKSQKQEQDSDLEKVKAYILSCVSCQKRQSEIKRTEIEKIKEGLSDRLIEATQTLWSVGQISRYKVTEGGVWIWRGV